jgi:hypothetical protein
MRHSQYRLSGEEGDAEVAVFVGIGGTVQQNVDRWISQFVVSEGSEAAETEQKQINGLQVTLVDVSGAYNPGMASTMGTDGGPKQDYRMLGAVIEAPDGPWFIKLTGPEGTVSKWEDSFGEYLASVRKAQ